MPAKRDRGDLLVKGKVYDSNDMTFREEREVRDVLRGLLGVDTLDDDQLSLADIFPAACLVLRRRDEPEFTLDEALDLKRTDVLIEEAEEEAKKPNSRSGPTKPSARSSPAKRTPESSGPPK